MAGALSDDEVASRLAGADVLCAPSLYGESFGMVLLEGMAAGCAVVASDIEGYRIAAGGHATLVPPGDAGALARALDVGAGEPGPRSTTAARRRRRTTPGPGRWTPWPGATGGLRPGDRALRQPGLMRPVGARS